MQGPIGCGGAGQRAETRLARLSAEDRAADALAARRRLVPGAHLASVRLSSRDLRLEAPFSVAAAGR